MTNDEIAERLRRWNYEQVIYVGKDVFKCYPQRGDECLVRAYVDGDKLVVHVYSYAATDEISL